MKETVREIECSLASFGNLKKTVSIYAKIVGVTRIKNSRNRSGYAHPSTEEE